MARSPPATTGESCVTQALSDFDIKGIGKHMSRQRYQRGALKPFVPARKGKPQRQLPRGTYWARWYRYVKTANGRGEEEPSGKDHYERSREELPDRTEYDGSVTKADAQRVLDLLIARDAGTYIPPDTCATWTRSPESISRPSNQVGVRTPFVHPRGSSNTR